MLYTYNDTLPHKLKSALSLTWLLLQVPAGSGNVIIGKTRDDVELQQTNIAGAAPPVGFGYVLTPTTNLTAAVPWAGDIWVRAVTSPAIIVIIETTDPSEQTQPRGVPQLPANAGIISTAISGSPLSAGVVPIRRR